MNRRATVHDLTTLSLHPTGSRVQAGQTNAFQDARGNWIARDAGGRGVVAKRRRARLRAGDVSSEEEQEESQRYDLTGVDVLSEARDDNNPQATQRGKAAVEVQVEIDALKDKRARKRRKFVHDVDFLEDSANSQKTQKSGLPNPSSDLLKHIHHFASHYYTSQNLLFDSSREYRLEKKQRRERKLAAEAGLPVKGKFTDSISDEETADASQEKQGDDDDKEEEEEEDSENSDAPSASKKKASKVEGKKKAKRNREEKKKHLRRDMYKVLDGSALLAIGMLLQHHIASLLEAPIPDGWEDEMDREMDRTGGEGVRPRGGNRRKRGNVQTKIVELREEEEESEEDGAATEAGTREVNTEEDDGIEDKRGR